MRAVIYVRYSSDLQSAASAQDQIAICKERIDREGWTLAGVFRDEGHSGASVLRPGYQNLLQVARSRAFDVVVAEASTASAAIRGMWQPSSSRRSSRACAS